MADFRGMICWEPAVAASTINTEAVSPSRAVFLATHAPLRIKRARIMGGRELVLEGDPISEQEVFEEFLALRPDSGALLMPIVGDSGSGKSHLVRWVREQFAAMEDGADDREIIYLEKSKTSLKAVVSTLLAKAESDELTQLKQDINRFTEDIDEDSLARRILNELSEALEATPPSTESRPLARMLVGPGKLAAALLDPTFAQSCLLRVSSCRNLPANSFTIVTRARRIALKGSLSVTSHSTFTIFDQRQGWRRGCWAP